MSASPILLPSDTQNKAEGARKFLRVWKSQWCSILMCGIHSWLGAPWVPQGDTVEAVLQNAKKPKSLDLNGHSDFEYGFELRPAEGYTWFWIKVVYRSVATVLM